MTDKGRNSEDLICHWGASFLEDVPLLELMYLVFTRMPSGVTIGGSGLCCWVPCLLSTTLSPLLIVQYVFIVCNVCCIVKLAVTCNRCDGLVVADAPSPPYNVTGEAVSSSRVRVQWEMEPSTDNLLSFTVHKRLAHG